MAVEGTPEAPAQKFRTPEEELAYLRERLSAVEERLDRKPSEAETTSHEKARQVVREYAAQEPETVLHEKVVMPEHHVESVVLNLAPEKHDSKMVELLGIMKEKGIRNTLSIVAKLDDPHIEDDFHRFVVEYLKEGYPVRGLKEKGPVWKALSKTLFEVAVPGVSKDDEQKELKQLISSMEQFYAGMMALSSGDRGEWDHLTLEIATSVDREEAIFYIAVPDKHIELFEKHLLSIFPQARLHAQKNDYNVFNTEGVSVGSYATLYRRSGYPLKMYEDFDYDPLNVLLSAFSKLKRQGEGAAIQVVFKPVGNRYTRRFKLAIDQLRKGELATKALQVPESIPGEIAKGFKDLFLTKSRNKKNDHSMLGGRHIDEVAIEQVTKKISSPIAMANIRLIASAASDSEATDTLAELESAFNQFEEAQGNQLIFKRVKGIRARRLFHRFTFREFSDAERMLLNLTELTTIYHLPVTDVQSSRELKTSKAGTAPAPIEVAKEGILLGINKYRNVAAEVYFTPEDRLRHFYTIGQTGTGKTTLLKNMIIQDIKNGEGVCMIDPHGTDIQDVLASIPPERHDDVIYFDPSYTARPMALNMLEYDTNYPEQKTFVVNELFSIFQKLYGDVPEALGPMFEQYFRNATMLVIEDPETGNTLLDVSRVLSEKSYRELKLSRCQNPVIVQFWREVAEKAGGEAALANIVPYITSKFDIFLANEIMRPIVAQPVSAFNFRRVMDEQKILLVNLAKGRLGDINADLLGLIIVGKILMAALSRVDAVDEGLPVFYLYIDEFQNVTTDSIATILSEARKYNLALSIAHQFIAQLEDNIRDAVFGNVGTLCAFRVGADDAEYLEQQFDPPFAQKDLMNVDNYNAYLKLLVRGVPVRPFNIETVIPEGGDQQTAELLRQRSYEQFGRPRDEVEADIAEKYRTR